LKKPFVGAEIRELALPDTVVHELNHKHPTIKTIVDLIELVKEDRAGDLKEKTLTIIQGRLEAFGYMSEYDGSLP
jgi:hypothetical protein